MTQKPPFDATSPLRQKNEPRDAYLRRIGDIYTRLMWTDGAGDGRTSACVNSLAGMLEAIQNGQELKTWTDTIPCIHDFVRYLGININDDAWGEDDGESNEEATKWMRDTAPRLLGTASISDQVMLVEALDQLLNDIPFEHSQHKIPRTEWSKKLEDVPAFIDARKEILSNNSDILFGRGTGYFEIQIDSLASSAHSAYESVTNTDRRATPASRRRMFADHLNAVASIMLDNLNGHEKRRCYATTLLNNMCALKEPPYDRQDG